MCSVHIYKGKNFCVIIMEQKELARKLKELSDLKKKVEAAPKPINFGKYKPKKVSEYTQYEDDILEDSDSIKTKRENEFNISSEVWMNEKKHIIKEAKIHQEKYKIAMANTLFPYPNMRDSQNALIQDIFSAVNQQKHIFAHAPTGLGKTIASLGPAIEYALRSKKIVFFLTSRQTQHMMAVKTVRDIKKKYDIKINILDIIGKKSMCIQDGIGGISGGDFSEFCKNSKKERTCQYYTNFKKTTGLLKLEAEMLIDELKNTVLSSEELIEHCRDRNLCPYEIAISSGEAAQVIISDYSYVFNPNIREIFFRKLGIDLSDCVLVIDEAHNLPDRTKDSASDTLTTSMLQRGIKEAEKYAQDEAALVMRNIMRQLMEMKPESKKKQQGYVADSAVLIDKSDINEIIEKTIDIETTCATLQSAAEEVRKKQKKSSIAGILSFIVSWQGPDEGFTRIFSKEENRVDGRRVRYACLDPSKVTAKVFDECDSAIAISATLSPTKMYADLLGAKDAILKNYKNPFPKENALHLIVPKTTTKFDKRNDEQFESIANECKKILKLVKGNTAIFFPSYSIRDRIYAHLYSCEEIFVLEEPSLGKEEKERLFRKFVEVDYQRKVLLGTSSGSFGEGVDFPGKQLTCVIVVGLPLIKPTLEINQQIGYYNKKFGKGWDYGYFYPSFNKTFQNVGRCIRSETDKGVMIYLDERFAEPRYLKFFNGRPYEISREYEDKIREFETTKDWE